MTSQSDIATQNASFSAAYAAPGAPEEMGDQEQQQQQQQQQQPELPQLPTDLIGLVVLVVCQSDLSSLRLCSTQFAAAIDPLVKAITLKAWPGKGCTLTRLRHVTRLDLNLCLSGHGDNAHNNGSISPSRGRGVDSDSRGGSRAAADEDWSSFKLLVSQLPHLTSLRLPYLDLDSSSSSSSSRMPADCNACLTALTRLDLEEPGYLPDGLKLPGLRAASFLSNEFPADLRVIAAFAPNLEQLGCRRLEITSGVPTVAAGAGGLGGSAAAGVEQNDAVGQQGAPAGPTVAAPAVLPKCTHFGGQAVTVTHAATPGQAAQAFGAAFPGLRVMYRVPQVSGAASKECGYDDLLAHLPLLTAIRGRNWFSSRSWFLIRSSGHLESDHWQKVTRLSFHSNSYPDGCSDFLDISKCTQLQALRLTFNYPFTKADELVRELERLPQLQSLALPAALLCGRCCPEKHYPGLKHCLERLAAKTSLRQLDLLTLPGATLGTTFFCGHPSSVREGMQALKAKAAAIRSSSSSSSSSSRGLRQQGPVRQGAKQQPQQQQQQRQQQQQQELELELKVEDPEWYVDSYLSTRGGGHGVWGCTCQGASGRIGPHCQCIKPPLAPVLLQLG